MNCGCTPPPADVDHFNPGLLAWWPFDEPNRVANTVVYDIAGAATNNDAVLVGNVTSAKGYVAGALSFDGSSGFVQVPDERELNFLQSFYPFFHSWSIEAWINPSATNGLRPIVDKRAPGPAGDAFYLSDGKLALQLGNGATLMTYSASGPTIPAGVWTHVAVTVDEMAGAGHFYINGVTAGSFAPWTNSILNRSPLLIGRSSYVGFPVTNYFQGLMDEVELVGRELSPAEISDLVSAGHAGKCKETCHTSWEAATHSPGTNAIEVSICNYSAVDYIYSWRILPSAPGDSPCESVSPIVTPSAGTLLGRRR